MRIIYSRLFLRQFKKLSLQQQETFAIKEDIFRANPFDSRLKTHKLTGVFEDFWSFSFSLRVIIEFHDMTTVVFHKIGTHDIYK